MSDNQPSVGRTLDLRLSLANMRELIGCLEHAVRCRCLALTPGAELELDRLEPRRRRSITEIIEDALPFLDLEAGGIGLFEARIRGRNVKFTIGPAEVKGAVPGSAWRLRVDF